VIGYHRWPATVAERRFMPCARVVNRTHAAPTAHHRRQPPQNASERNHPHRSPRTDRHGSRAACPPSRKDRAPVRSRPQLRPETHQNLIHTDKEHNAEHRNRHRRPTTPSHPPPSSEVRPAK
jgi:hypothetical protein